MLALLVTRLGSVQTVGRIADAIWAEHVPAGHVQTIQTYVSHLRSILGLDRTELATVNGGYRLDLADHAVDARRFQALVREGLEERATGDPRSAARLLAQALELWNGEVLEDLADYSFVGDYAGPLDELRLTAVEAWVGARLDLGEHERLVAELEELVGRHPLREQLHAYRMLALYRSGRQAEALRAYQEVRTLLDDELGVRPGTVLERLHERLLAQDPTLDLREPPPAPPARSAPRRFRIKAIALAGAAVLVMGTAAYGLVNRRTETLSALPANALGSVGEDGTLLAGVDLGPDPTALAAGAGSLWALSGAQGRLYRIDAQERRVVQTIPVGHSPSALCVDGHDVWVVNTEDGTVSRVNTDVNEVVDTLVVGSLPRAIASGPSGVWVANRGDNTIQRIDPTSGRLEPAIPVGGAPSAVAVVDGAVYVANAQDRSVVRVDPTTGEQRGGPITVGAGPSALVVDGEDLWVADSDDQSVTRVDRGSGREVARIPVGDGPTSLTVVDGKVWVASQYDGAVSVIDPARNAVEHRYAVGASPRAVVAGEDSVWVVSAPRSDAAHVGGTLVPTGVILPGESVGIDPTAQYKQLMTNRALRLVYDGLVALTYAGGPDSFTLVPDLATAIPMSTNGGRTYAFTVRRGIRFSDGSPVRPSDIKRGIFRALTIDAGYAGVSKIVGADECVEQPATCAIDRGVVVDDDAGTIVFHLTEPNSDFLFQLAYFGQATVPGAPPVETDRPLPGTGPYMISAYAQGTTFTLTRNPYFKQWSFAAQPGGYPDEIRFAKAATFEDTLRDVEQGRADVVSMGLQVDAGVLSDYARRYPSRITSVSVPALETFLMNPATSPFDDVRVRQAVNYAVDRRVLTELLGGRNRVEATCQMLPVNLPGHRPYCPYSQNPSEGPYSGADLAKAKALVAQAGKVGERVVVVGYDDPGQHAVTAYLVHVLDGLGFKATMHKDWGDTGDFADLLSHPERPWQIVRAPGWIADWPAASNFYFALASCHEVLGVRNPNLRCDRELDAIASRARSLENSDPTEARRLWAEVDRRVTDDAPFVFLFAKRQTSFVSKRAGNVQADAVGFTLLSQLWVK